MRDPASRYIAVALGNPAGVSAGRLRAAAAAALDGSCRVIRARDRMVVLVHELAADADAAVAAETIRARLATATGDRQLTAGVGSPSSGIGGLPVAIIQAEHALGVGRELFGHGRTTTFNSLGLYRFILGRPSADLEAFCAETLGPLATTGTRRLDELVATLDSYLRAQGNVNETARDQDVHRNTIRYRLRQIAALTGADLRNADTCLALRLALLARSALSTFDRISTAS